MPSVPQVHLTASPTFAPTDATSSPTRLPTHVPTPYQPCGCVTIQSHGTVSKTWADLPGGQCMGKYNFHGRIVAGRPVYVSSKLLFGSLQRPYLLYYHTKLSAWVVGNEINKFPFCLACKNTAFDPANMAKPVGLPPQWLAFKEKAPAIELVCSPDCPTAGPTHSPTQTPTRGPTLPTQRPTPRPSVAPSQTPTTSPSPPPTFDVSQACARLSKNVCCSLIWVLG